MKNVGKHRWDKYKNIVTNFMDNDAAKQPIIWKKASGLQMSYGEDKINPFLPDRELMVLIGYNYFRTWPINKATTSGELDSQNMTIWISSKFLSDRGYLNADGYFDFDQSLDRFIIKGITYKSSGDTDIAQASDSSVVFMMVLKREELENK